VTVGSQYTTSHVYLPPETLERFTASVVATFGGTRSSPDVIQVTPTPSQTAWQAVTTPVGILSAFGFRTPIPYPFGTERTGYLVSDLDVAVRAAESCGASVVVVPFADPIGRDAIIEWPGGARMQLYWHTTPPSRARLEHVPENRLYIAPARATTFVRDFVAFARARIVSDEPRAPGLEVGQPAATYRRIRIDSNFGTVLVLATDGHLPYPYGQETTGYEVAVLADTLSLARNAGVQVLVEPYTSESRTAAIVEFPGGYIAEIHSPSAR
jgi:hypothetical protein